MERGARSKKKTEVILELINELPEVKVTKWLEISKLPKSSFYEWKKKIECFEDKDIEIKSKIKDIVLRCKKDMDIEEYVKNLEIKELLLIIKKFYE